MRREYVAAIDHEVTGELGWKDKRIGYNTPYGPISYNVGLAHDALEHFAFSSVADEIMAHGAIYWGRYWGGWQSPNGRGGLSLEDIGGEWVALYHALISGEYIDAPARTLRLDAAIEEDISEIIVQGRRQIREEVSYTGNEFGWLPTADKIEKVFRGWFRLGYRKAEKVYRKGLGWTSCEFSYRFEQLSNRFALKAFQPDYEGQELRLEIGKNGFSLQHVEG